MSGDNGRPCPRRPSSTSYSSSSSSSALRRFDDIETAVAVDECVTKKKGNRRKLLKALKKGGRALGISSSARTLPRSNVSTNDDKKSKKKKASSVPNGLSSTEPLDVANPPSTWRRSSFNDVELRRGGGSGGEVGLCDDEGEERIRRSSFNDAAYELRERRRCNRSDSEDDGACGGQGCHRGDRPGDDNDDCDGHDEELRLSLLAESSGWNNDGGGGGGHRRGHRQLLPQSRSRSTPRLGLDRRPSSRRSCASSSRSVRPSSIDKVTEMDYDVSLASAPATMQLRRQRPQKRQQQGPQLARRHSDRLVRETHDDDNGRRRQSSRSQIYETSARQEPLGLQPQMIPRPKPTSQWSTPPPSSAATPATRIDVDDNATQKTFNTMRTRDTKDSMSSTKASITSSDKLKMKRMRIPKGDVTIVFTDVQGSTSLWESDPTAMKEASDIHDDVVRKCYAKHDGYEVHTEGDAFVLAFQHPVDALAFALRMQIHLHEAPWPKGVLDHPDGEDVPGSFRGFRVRVGMHHGPTDSRVHDVTGRTIYEGDAVKIAKRVEAMAHGGQILTTVETWRAVSGMAERYLGSPQVVDCGEHLLWDGRGNGGFGERGGPMSKRVVQLVPKQLAFDYFAARGREGKPECVKTDADVTGRRFPPLKSRGALSASFLDAPHENGTVTMVFVYTLGMEEFDSQTKKRNLSVLADLVRSELNKSKPPRGYECQEDDGSWMLSFPTATDAVRFGLDLRSSLGAAPLVGNVTNRRRATMLKIGIHSGPYTSMGPHKVTGRADYFGPIVNRAARVASAALPGHVCVGLAMEESGRDEGVGEVIAKSPDFGRNVQTKFVGAKRLKGLTFDMALFSCYRDIGTRTPTLERRSK